MVIRVLRGQGARLHGLTQLNLRLKSVAVAAKDLILLALFLELLVNHKDLLFILLLGLPLVNLKGLLFILLLERLLVILTGLVINHLN